MIAAMGMNGQLNALYPQYNVNLVQATKRIKTVDSEDSFQADIKKNEEKASSVSVPEELKNATQVAYSQNPYDQARKLADSTLLLGQNLDYVA